MKFVIICHDKPGSAALRTANRPAHRAYIETVQSKLVHAGAMSNAAGETCGSLLIVEAADRAEAERITANDPYAKVGLFESTTIRNYRVAIQDGVRVS